METRCNICWIEAKKKEHISVIFTGNKEQPRICENYFDNKWLDLCDICHKKALQWNSIHADRINWFYNYFFKHNIK